MKDPQVIRDERTESVENASYKMGFTILSFGLLVDIILRSVFFQQAPWDLFALVIGGGWAATIYQGLHKTLPPHFWRSMLLVGLMTAVLSAVLAFVIIRARGF